MKQTVRGVGGSVRGWFLLTGVGLMLVAAAIFGLSHGLAKIGLSATSTRAQAVATVTQPLGSRVKSLSAFERVLIVAPAPGFRAVSKRLGLAASNAVPAPLISNLAISKIVQSAVTSASNPNQTGPIGPATPQNGAVVTGTAVLPGTFLTYRITVTNNGPSDVSNIRVTDVLPAGLETPPARVLGAKFVSATQVIPSGATFTCAPPTGVNPSNNPQGNGGSVVCTAPFLEATAPNNVAALDVTIFIDPATRASLVDTATVDATFDAVNPPVFGSTTLTTPIVATSDVRLTKTHTNAAGVLGGTVTVGTDFEYQVTVTNNGPSAAPVSLVDTIPAFQALRQRAQAGPPPLVPDIVIEAVPDNNGAPIFTCTPDADATTDARATGVEDHLAPRLHCLQTGGQMGQSTRRVR